MTKKRYPLAALASAVGLSEHALCVRLGISGTTMQVLRRDGVSELQADRYAVRLNLHAYSVWPEMIDEAAEETSRVCECGERFYPRTKRHLFCSPRCRRRVKMRRYRSTPSGAENNRKHRRNWYAECREYDLATSRRRRELMRRAS